jgi:hypothetical protein
MNILDRLAREDEWVSVVDCHLCNKQTPTKETHIIPVNYEYFGVKGYKYVQVCKECHREEQLNKII